MIQFIGISGKLFVFRLILGDFKISFPYVLKM